MTVTVEFHFDFGSPNAYLSHLALPGIAQRTGATITYVPILLGGVFKATGNVSPAVSLQGIKNKPEYQQIETQRFLDAHNITRYQRNPHFPVNTLMLMRGATFAQDKEYFAQYVNEMFDHMWAEPKKMDDPEVVAQVLASSSLPGDEILAGVQDPAVKQRLIDSTERVVQMGTFGSPTFFVGQEIYFGKDKLGEVEAEILKQSS